MSRNYNERETPSRTNERSNQSSRSVHGSVRNKPTQAPNYSTTPAFTEDEYWQMNHLVKTFMKCSPHLFLAVDTDHQSATFSWTANVVPSNNPAIPITANDSHSVHGSVRNSPTQPKPSVPNYWTTSLALTVDEYRHMTHLVRKYLRCPPHLSLAFKPDHQSATFSWTANVVPTNNTATANVSTSSGGNVVNSTRAPLPTRNTFSVRRQETWNRSGRMAHEEDHQQRGRTPMYRDNHTIEKRKLNEELENPHAPKTPKVLENFVMRSNQRSQYLEEDKSHRKSDEQQKENKENVEPNVEEEGDQCQQDKERKRRVQREKGRSMRFGAWMSVDKQGIKFLDLNIDKSDENYAKKIEARQLLFSKVKQNNPELFDGDIDFYVDGTIIRHGEPYNVVRSKSYKGGSHSFQETYLYEKDVPHFASFASGEIVMVSYQLIPSKNHVPKVTVYEHNLNTRSNAK